MAGFKGSNNPFYGPDQGKPDHGKAGQHKHLNPAMIRRLKKKHKKASPMVKGNSKGFPGLNKTHRKG